MGNPLSWDGSSVPSTCFEKAPKAKAQRSPTAALQTELRGNFSEAIPNLIAPATG